MADHDAHVRKVQRLTTQIRDDGASQESRDEASAKLADAWKTYNRQK